MADITINIPDAQLSRVANAIAARNGYRPAYGSKSAFAKQQLIRWIISEVTAYEAQAAAEAAADTVRSAVIAEVVLA